MEDDIAQAPEQDSPIPNCCPAAVELPCNRNEDMGNLDNDESQILQRLSPKPGHNSEIVDPIDDHIGSMADVESLFDETISDLNNDRRPMIPRRSPSSCHNPAEFSNDEYRSTTDSTDSRNSESAM